MVMPKATPIWVSASVWSIGAIRSLTGPSNFCRKAAVTRCAPAGTWIAGDFTLRLVVPSYIFGSMASSARRSPSIEISICSSVDGAPNRNPQALPWRSTRNTYSPSAGKVCTTDRPPRVPNGAPSTRCSCDAVFGTR